MNIPQTLKAEFNQLCMNLENQNQVFEAMICTTTKSMKKIKQQGVCDLLKRLRKNNVATNEVEHGVNKLCKLWSSNQKNGLKRKLMRHKISDAISEYKKIEYDCSMEWRKCKTVIPIQLRMKFNNLWKTFINQFRRKIR